MTAPMSAKMWCLRWVSSPTLAFFWEKKKVNFASTRLAHFPCRRCCVTRLNAALFSFKKALQIIKNWCNTWGGGGGGGGGGPRGKWKLLLFCLFEVLDLGSGAKVMSTALHIREKISFFHYLAFINCYVDYDDNGCRRNNFWAVASPFRLISPNNHITKPKWGNAIYLNKGLEDNFHLTWFITTLIWGRRKIQDYYSWLKLLFF